MAGKPPSTKNIEKALGIGDNVLKDMSSDDEKKKQFEERQEKLKKIHAEFQRKKVNYEQDKDFIKDVYRELIEQSMMAVRIMNEEAGMTGDYKNVEALAAAAGSVHQALEGLKNVELDEEKLRIEREKVDIRRTSVNSVLSNNSTLPGIGTSNTTNVFVGSTAELLKSIREAEKEMLVEVQAEVVDKAKDIVAKETIKEIEKEEESE
jgi:hypothetical protein